MGLLDWFAWSNDARLGAAVRRGDRARVAALVAAGADPNARCRGETPLTLAAFGRDAETAGLLLRLGADPDRANRGGATALFVACRLGDLDLARVLLEAGADSGLGLPDGRTPFVAAKHSRHDAVADLVERYARVEPVGPVFLSWTKRHPRDSAAMELLMLALDQYHVRYFDYTRFQMDNSRDQSDAIRALLDQKVRESACSIEIISSEVLVSDWVQYERQLLRDHEKTRLFACIDEHYMLAVADRPEVEARIIRLNLSDGRLGIHAPTYAADYRRAGYFRSVEYRAATLRLARLVRRAVPTKHWDPLRNDGEFSRCSI